MGVTEIRTENKKLRDYRPVMHYFLGLHLKVKSVSSLEERSKVLGRPSRSVKSFYLSGEV